MAPATLTPSSAADTPTTPHTGAAAGLVVGALGVVFGDIGTSPLYALRETFLHDTSLAPTPEHVLGVLSVLFWAVTLTVTIKYVTLIMRADNKGEGGVLALATLATHGLNGGSRRIRLAITLLAVVGLALFYGDAIITPAITVMSAVEGLSRRGPGLHALRPAAGARDPGRAVPAAGARHRRCRPAVRAGHAAVVHRAGRAGPLADRQASRRAPRHQPDLRLSPHRRPGARHLLGLRLHRPGGHRRRGALRRHGPFRPQADPHGLAQPRHAGPAAQLLRPGRDDHRRSHDRAAGVLRAGAAGLHHRAGGAVDPGLRHRLAGGHHRRVLAHPPGDPARLPAAHGDQAHLRDRDRPDLHPARQLDPDGAASSPWWWASARRAHWPAPTALPSPAP